MDLIFIILSLVILLFSAILHEIAHGYVAERLGDPTARLSGRLTLDPRKHIDPFMSLLLPLMLLFSGSPVIFGGAKPVPIDPYNLKEGRKDVALVSLAGPLTNLLIAIIASFLLKFISLPLLSNILGLILHINVLLAVFNLLPLPPLDGSKLFALLLPEDLANRYLSIGFIGILLLYILLLGPLSAIIFQISSFLEMLLIR